MKKTLFLALFLLLGQASWAQVAWKTFVTTFPAMPFGKEMVCTQTLNLAPIIKEAGDQHLQASNAEAYLKVGKIIFKNGNIGLAYAIQSGSRYIYYLDIFDKKGKKKDGYTLGTTFSTGEGETFTVIQQGDEYVVKKTSETFTIDQNGNRKW